MLLAWKKYPVIILSSYIIGFANDTKDSILRDIETIKRELPIDFLNISILTPLPGSEDHRKLVDEGVWMDSDLNKYDLTHRVTHHPIMTDEEFDQVYEMAWNNYYSFEHMVVVLRRMFALGSNKKLTTIEWLIKFGVVTRVHGIRSYDAGLLRRKNRKDRRPGLPLENPLIFYIKYFFSSIIAASTIWWVYRRLLKKMRQILNDPEKINYIDAAITPSLGTRG